MTPSTAQTEVAIAAAHHRVWPLAAAMYMNRTAEIVNATVATAVAAIILVFISALPKNPVSSLNSP